MSGGIAPRRGLPPGQNFLGLAPEHSDPGTAAVVLLPFPYERTSSYGRGSCDGPAAVLEASRNLELFDLELDRESWRAAGGIATMPPLPTDGDGPAAADRLRREVSHLLEDGKFVVTLGGEHSSVVGAILAHVEHHPEATVLQLDAHSDLRPSYEGDPWSHACAMARVLDRHPRLVQVGIRSQSARERAIADELGLPVFPAHVIHAMQERGEDWIGRIVDATGPEVYVTFDCDVLDPSVMPPTGTPEPGGLDWRQVEALLSSLCSQRRIVGLDVSELAPIAGLNHPQFTVAKLIYRILGRRLTPGADR